jgi:OmpA-OmpF porin, OOP family
MKLDTRTVAFLTLVAGLGLTPAAHAQWMGLKQDTGLYLGAAVGQSKVRNLCDDLAGLGVTSCDERDTAWKLSVGYQFHRHFAAEAGYVDFGKATASIPGATATIKTRGIEVLAVAKVPLTQSFGAHAKAGFVRWDTSGSVADDNGTEFTFGLGLSYDFNQNFSARLEWQRYTDLVIDTVMLGAVYKFR